MSEQDRPAEPQIDENKLIAERRGKLDELIPWRQAERLASEAAGPVELLVIDDGNHVANNRGYRYRAQSADWMADCLAG